MAQVSLDAILNQITTTNNISALNHALRNTLPRESRDTILASPLSTGQDPLSVLDLRNNTLGVLYILSARLSVSGAQLPPFNLIQQFCATFIPEQARLAPDRVTALAKGIVRYANHLSNLKCAVQPLHDLVYRYPPDPAHLTTIHPIFILTCLQTYHLSATLPLLLNYPITTTSTTLSDLSYTDALTYHYLGGIILTMLERWFDAEEYFEICVTCPAVGGAISGVQMEALKKLRLVQLISRGETPPLPKYVNPHLLRLLKATPYNAFINAYPHNVDALKAVLERERALFATEKTTGLLNQALARAPRWTLKKLTATYVTLGLAEIGRAIGIPCEDEEGEAEVRRLVLSMIEAGDISARLSTTATATTTVTFSDLVPQFSKAQVDGVVRAVQEQMGTLGALEQEVSRGREYLSKALRTREETSWGQAASEEEMYAAMSGIGAGRGPEGAREWVEEGMFT